MRSGKSKQLSSFSHRAKGWYARVFSRKPIAARVEQIKTWFSSPLGRYIGSIEDQCLKTLISDYHGQRVLHLTVVEESEFVSPSAFKRILRVYPDERFGCERKDQVQCAISEFDQLPFSSESFDVVLLQHTLEFSHRPQQILKEAARVLNHGGHCAIIGFNPMSINGLVSLVWGRVQPKSIAYRQTLLAYRIKDWLRFVDCNHLQTLNIGHTLPLNQARFVELFTRFGKALDNINLPFAAVYCLVARKDSAGMTFVKPSWRRGVLQPGLAMPKTAQPLSIVARLKKREKLEQN